MNDETDKTSFIVHRSSLVTMLTPVYCNGCGKRLDVPAGYGRAKMRCEDCGVFTELPKEVREQGQAAEAESPPASPGRAEPQVVRAAKPKTPPKPKPAPAAPANDDGYQFVDDTEDDKPPTRETLIAGTQDDDLNPYTVTGDAPTKRCLECERKVEIAAKVCVHCGYNFESKEKAKRTYQPIDKTWESGLPFEKRLMIFIGLQVVNFVTLVASVIGGYSLGVTFILVLMTVGLQAFLCGTFDKLILTRNPKGKVTLTTIWRYAFIPRPPDYVKWKEHESVIVVRSNEFDPIDWCFALILLGYCIIPGVAFWYFVIRPDKFAVTLCRDHGFPETPIFRTSNETLANEILRTVSEVTTLPVHK